MGWKRLLSWTRYGRDELTGLRIRPLQSGGYEFVDPPPAAASALRVRDNWRAPVPAGRFHLPTVVAMICYVVTVLAAFPAFFLLAREVVRHRPNPERNAARHAE